MGSTKGVQPSWRFATMTIQTIPSASCPHRDPPDMTRWVSAVPNAVMTVVPPLLGVFQLCRYRTVAREEFPAPPRLDIATHPPHWRAGVVNRIPDTSYRYFPRCLLDVRNC